MSDSSASGNSAEKRAQRAKIRARIKQRSSRLLSLLGLRSSASATRSIPLQPLVAPNPDQLIGPLSLSPSPPGSVKKQKIGHGHDVSTTEGERPTGTPRPSSQSPRPSTAQGERPSSILRSRAAETRRTTSTQPRLQRTDVQENRSPINTGLGRSRSSPAGLACLISRTLSTKFGNPTVIRRSHLRSRPSVQAVQFEQPTSDPLSKQGDNAADSSVLSTPLANSVSPVSSKSTPPTSASDRSRSSNPPAKPGSLPSTSAAAPALSPIPEPCHTAPSVVTVEAAANAKVFLETYFGSIWSAEDPRAERRYELEQYIYSVPLTPEDRVRIWRNWVLQEREYLRQCRVLKTRSQGRTCHEQTVAMAGFEILKILGKGSFGVVRLVKEKGLHPVSSSDCGAGGTQALSPDSMDSSPSQETLGSPSQDRRKVMTGERKDVFAMKVIRKSAMVRNCQEGHLRAERDFLVASAKSRWIVPLIASFQDQDNLYLIMDYMVGGDFLGLLMRRWVLPEHITRWYIAEMILCVEEAHRLRWIHRDVKPDNFLISASGHLKISDFGLAFDGHWAHDQTYYTEQRYSLVKRLGLQIDGDAQDRKEARKAATKASEKERLGRLATEYPCPSPSIGLLGWRDRHQKRKFARSVVGTSQYMAPEVIRAELYDGRCDWWSVGIILYECLYGFTPFASEDRQKTKLKIHHHHQTLRFPMQKSSDKAVSRDAVDLINHLLQEKEYRLCSGKYRENDALTTATRGDPRHFFYSLDLRNREQRWSFVYPDDARDIKAHSFFRGIKWDEIHRSSPPFVPKVKGWEDTRYFDDCGYTFEDDNLSMMSELEPSGSEDEEASCKGSGQDDDGAKSPPTPDDAPQTSASGNKESPKKDKKKKAPARKRPRDKLLRDKKVGKTVLEMRKKGAFAGYTYRRPKAVALAFAPDRGRPYLPQGHLSELYG